MGIKIVSIEKFSLLIFVPKVRILGAELGLPAELIHRHPFPGPGLAIRIICQEEPYMEKDFPETQVLCRLVVNYKDMVEKVSFLLFFDPHI